MVGRIDNVVRHDHCLDVAGIHVVEGFTAVVIDDNHWSLIIGQFSIINLRAVLSVSEQ